MPRYVVQNATEGIRFTAWPAEQAPANLNRFNYFLFG